jgi:hypothetical protein
LTRVGWPPRTGKAWVLMSQSMGLMALQLLEGVSSCATPHSDCPFFAWPSRRPRIPQAAKAPQLGPEAKAARAEKQLAREVFPQVEERRFPVQSRVALGPKPAAASPLAVTRPRPAEAERRGEPRQLAEQKPAVFLRQPAAARAEEPQADPAVKPVQAEVQAEADRRVAPRRPAGKGGGAQEV